MAAVCVSNCYKLLLLLLLLLLGLSDEALLSTLTAVRGIGPWTVDMFSMFHLGRPNILPVGDLGVRKVRLRHHCGDDVIVMIRSSTWCDLHDGVIAAVQYC